MISIINLFLLLSVRNSPPEKNKEKKFSCSSRQGILQGLIYSDFIEQTFKLKSQKLNSTVSDKGTDLTIEFRGLTTGLDGI